MTFRALARACGPCRALAGVALLAAFAPAAHAVPPSFTGQPVTVPIPAIGESVAVNLRQQGVITGSAPIDVSTGQGTVFIDGVFSTALTVFAPGVDEPGSVCLVVVNNSLTPQPSLRIEFNATLRNFEDGSAAALVRLIDGPAQTVDPGDASCRDFNQRPIANAGADRSIADSDAAPGENVTLQGSAIDPEGEPVSYRWLDASGALLATEPTPTVALPDGVNVLTLEVLDQSSDDVATDTVMITVNPSAAPVANAGPDRTVADTDREAGELVTLDGSGSSDPDGTIASYSWFRQDSSDGEESLGSGVTLSVALPDGANTIRLQVTDNVGNTASDTAVISVGVPPQVTTLSELPNLSRTQRSVAQALDRICADLRERGDGLSPEQRDLAQRCNGLLFNNTAANQAEALDELAGDDFAVARTQTLLFANTQYVGVMDRLIALRGGARGLSLAGLNIIVDGKPVPLAQLQDIAQELLGGGASADEEPGGLLSDKWGLWARGNFSFGEKDRSSQSPGFDADQWALIGGLDYRLSDQAVLGAALAYGQSQIDFVPADEGALDTESWAISLYGSMYAARNFYLDAIVNVASARYDAERNIVYVDGSGLVDADARGDTDGVTLSGGLSGGYDFLLGGLTIAPNLGFFYVDTTIDGFTEEGAGGLNLIYDEQQFTSLTGNLGLRLTYAWNLSWGVLLPHLRVDYVREFEDDVEVFGVRFAADPNAPSTPPILVETDNPDQSYWRLAAGFSTQFKYGLSGYIEYQRLEGFQFISFQDVSIGLRMQRSF